MNSTSEVNDNSVTLLEWLDALARGTTPLPHCPKVVSAQRFLRKVGVVLAWSFTLAMLTGLILGSLITSICLAYGAFLAAWIYWHVLLVLVTSLGTLAFVSAARFVESAIFLVVSPLVNLGYFCAGLGLATVEPLLVIPLHLALNSAYFLIVWWFLLRGKRVRYLMEPITSEVIR